MVFGESPEEGARRELFEESGFTAADMHLRGLVTQVYPHRERMKLKVLYACTNFSGKLTRKGDGEGRLKWQHLHRVHQLSMPPAVEFWTPFAVNLNAPVYQARFVYNEMNEIVERLEQR